MRSLKDLPYTSIFNELDQKALDHISLKKYKHKQKLIEADSRSNMDLFLILKGIAFVSHSEYVTYSWYSTPYHVHQGDFIGLSELLSPTPVKRELNVIAKTPVTALCIEGNEFLSWQSRYPKLYNTIIYTVLRKNFSTKDRLTFFSAFPSDLAGAQYLSHLYQIYRSAGYDDAYSGPVRIWETHQDIAYAIMKNVRSVDRLLNKLKSQGLIDVVNRKIYIDPVQANALYHYKSSESNT